MSTRQAILVFAAVVVLLAALALVIRFGIIGSAFFNFSPSISWAGEIKDIDVSPSAANCLNNAPPKQSFSARLSTQAPGTYYQGTFLQLSGSPTVNYISDGMDLGVNYDGRIRLEYDLWKKGFRIIELKFSSKTGWNPDNHPDEQWRGNGLACTTEPLVKALAFLESNGAWPSRPNDRFAMGSSNGAMMLAYAIDYFKSPSAKVNRALVQSPVVFDAYQQCKESPSLPFNQFYLGDLCTNAEKSKDVLLQQSIASKLDQNSCQNQTTPFNSFLIVGGKKDEVPAWYKDEFSRYVPTRASLCPARTAFWDAAETYEGHAPIESYYKLKGNVDPFVNYFVNGNILLN